jgi:molybdenum cofactor cytidylyltransferase
MSRPVDQAIIILAAGSSSRMGKSKQLLDINGRTLLEQTVTRALETGILNILVVLGANAEKHLRVLRKLGVESVINPEWENGMGTSLKCGVKKSIELFGDIQSVMVLVCDQPLLTTRHLKALSNFFLKEKQKAVASMYNSVAGVPAIFGKELFANLLKVADKTGAREVLKNLGNELKTISFEGGEIDLDTPEDYKKFTSRFNKK